MGYLIHDDKISTLKMPIGKLKITSKAFGPNGFDELAPVTIRAIETGNPSTPLLLIASDVIKVAGLDRATISRYAKKEFGKQSKSHPYGRAFKLRDLLKEGELYPTLNPLKRVAKWQDLLLFEESLAYEMLLRGNAPQTEPFRKWVCAELLPIIREYGEYTKENLMKYREKQAARKNLREHSELPTDIALEGEWEVVEKI